MRAFSLLLSFGTSCMQPAPYIVFSVVRFGTFAFISIWFICVFYRFRSKLARTHCERRTCASHRVLVCVSRIEVDCRREPKSSTRLVTLHLYMWMGIIIGKRRRLMCVVCSHVRVLLVLIHSFASLPYSVRCCCSFFSVASVGLLYYGQLYGRGRESRHMCAQIIRYFRLIIGENRVCCEFVWVFTNKKWMVVYRT